ncbi:hypothetical protein I6N98_15885 [Spongiibacter nanhainus]|uniref:Uncharacterized protein n=1 Tax=Spongiibacter nanhainus TaxID=2794344 RepID=A0A7T4QZT2_9GAMM|nr:hypothetical protein [Spongiibacter nanhainus]QQD17801.1 hypothetical protein I6N98_15885 [Spongiibacter nanhainus]
MNTASNEQLALVMETIAQSMAHAKEVAMDVHEADDIHHRCHLLGVIERVLEHTGAIADRWAKELGGNQWRGDLNEWFLPPRFHELAKTED